MSGYLKGVLARARGDGVLLRPLPQMYHGEPASEIDLGPPAAVADAPPASPRRAERPIEGGGPSRAPVEPQAPPHGSARGREDSPDPGRPFTRFPEEPPETGASDDGAARTVAPADRPRIAPSTEDPPVQTVQRRAGEERLERAARWEPAAVTARPAPRPGSRRDRRAAAEPPAAPAPARPAAALVRESPEPEAAAPEPIRVSIGRVEIRAAVAQPVAAPSIREPRQSLDAFLRAREGGRDR
jgi:hypothetical protein